MDGNNYTCDVLSRELQKDRSSFTAADVRSFVLKNELRLINLCYVGRDGRLKSMTFAPLDEAHFNRLLHEGERVDGSNLFSYIDPSACDLYVVPRYSTAFLNPFSAEPALNLFATTSTPRENLSRLRRRTSS